MAAKKFDLSLLPKQPDFEFEAELWSRGFTVVAGIDEAGRGALAGPLAAAAVIFQPDRQLSEKLSGVRDSKMMSPSQREIWAARLPEMVQAYAIAFASSQEIDQIGILPATCLAMKRSIDGLLLTPQHLLVDYLKISDCQTPQTPLVKGDARSLSIAAASIFAKVARDQRMRDLDSEYPGYGFAQHKGYGTTAHRKALADLGPSPAHRRSFRLDSERVR